MATRIGDANENGNDNLCPDQLQQPNIKRRSTRYNVGPTIPHHGFVFKAFTRESVVNIEKRKRSKEKKNSTAYLDPAKPKPQPDPYLASGQQLPPALIKQLPPELIGKPIEDIDPYYADQETFVIISRGKELTRFSATKALYLLGPFHPIRRVVLYILVNPVFNLLVILTILTNCILMTIQGSEMVEKTEIIFTIVYTTEMGLKVLARGFIVDDFTYMRDPWNWLDFGVIAMAYLTIVVQDLGNLSVMRTFRVLRALKTVAIIPGMKTIVGAVIDSVKNLKDVVVLTLFSLSVFSLLGLQIYMGQLTQKCILDGPTNMTDQEWYSWCNNSTHWVPEPDDEIYGAYRLCGNATGAQSCPNAHTCLQGFGPNPDYGFTNFDTFGWALICSFRLMTQDFWEGLYMQVLKTAGSWHIIFFILSIFLGSIYLMNLILAIVAMSYNELQRRAEEEEEAAAEDEAAFLESCRLMQEMQEQMTEYSNNTMGGQTSYRPSIEIGLVGQSMLASLCQNGLLSQQIREKLNQQMILPGMGDPNIRSHSLSVNLEPRGQHTIDSGGRSMDGRRNDNTAKRASMAPNYYDPITMASSMTELRRGSSNRTIESNSPTQTSPTNSTAIKALRTQISPNKLHVSTSSMLAGSRGRKGSGVRQDSSDQQDMMGVGRNGRWSTRTSTTSDRDLAILRQRAALIRIVSDDCSDNKAPPEGDGNRPTCSIDEPASTDHPSMNCPMDKLSPEDGSTSLGFARLSLTTPNRVGSARRRKRRRQSELERPLQTDSEASQPIQQQQQQHQAMIGQQEFSMRSKHRTKSHENSLEQQSIQGDDESVKNYLARTSRHRSEVAICEQPTSAHPFGAIGIAPAAETTVISRAKKRRSTGNAHRSSVSKRRSIISNASENSNSMDQSIASQKSCIEPPTQPLVGRLQVLGGSTRALNLNSSSRHPSVAIMSSTSNVQQLGIDRCLQGSKMHHLSVENFQQFGANRPQLSSPSHQQRQPSIDLQHQGGRFGGFSMADNEYNNEQQHLRSRGRLESRGYIHPSTMARSSFARPRQSIVTGGINGGGGGVQQVSGARRMSQDFARRASDWSRLSMSANVDLRRLLRLWAHTNPYQKRPSVGSSNYSQAFPSAFESPSGSVRDFNNIYGNNNTEGSRINSPRPSSAGSARQAYELISAFSRRQNRYPTDQRYALPLDDDLIDKMSVNMRDKCLAYCLSCLDILCIWECCGAWLKIQKIISILVFDPFTELFIILCILINTLFMALDSDDADAQMKSIFERGNYFFTATFAVEASMKIMALSPKFYFRDGWNVFDSIIVGLSLLELGLEGVYGLSVLRSFRLLRVFKLAKSWPTLNLLISIMGKAVGDLGNLTFVLAIIVFIFAVMGMQLFGSKYVDHNFPSGELPRWNFTDFMHSFMIVFRILCAEWIEPMWDCLLVGGWPCIPFFLIAVTVGNLVVLNLFLALLLASFGASNLSSPQADSVDTKKLQEAIARFSRFGRWIRRKIFSMLSSIGACLLGRRKRKGRDLSSGINHGGSSGLMSMDHKHRPVKSHIAAMSKLDRLKNIELRTEELKSKIRRSPEHHYHLKQLAQSQVKESSRVPRSGTTGYGYNYNYKDRKHYSPVGQSANATGATGPIPFIPIIVNEPTEGCADTDEQYDTVSCQLDDDDGVRRIKSPTLFISPAITQEVGEINENQASIADLYRSKLGSGVGIITNSPEVDTLTSVSSSSSSSSLKSPESTYKETLSTLGTQSALAGYKQQLGRHHLYSAGMQPIREDSRDAESCTSYESESIHNNDKRSLDKLAQHEISHHHLSITRRRNSLSSTTQDSNSESNDHNRRWQQSREDHEFKSTIPDINDNADGTSQTSQMRNTFKEELKPVPGVVVIDPVEEHRPKSSLYLKAPKREDMEEEDEKTLQHIETYIEKCICLGILCLKWFLFRQYVRKIVEHKLFDQSILVLIVFSSGTLALEDKHLNERPTLKRTLDILDTIFTIIFSLEMILKWLAFGVKRYFGNIWSWLDFVIVLVSFINLMASIFGSGKIQALKTMRTLRAMRGLRPLRALQRFQGMRVVVNALIQAIPSIFNVLLVCLIFWLIFSIMGVQMFGGKFWRCIHPETRKVVSYDVAANRQECIERNLTWANPQINFDNVLNAYLALFQVATFKGWIDIMNSATDSRTRDDQPIREANIYMYFYFVFFVIFGSFFTLNLFIGVIIDNFNEQKKKTGGSLEIFMTDDQKKYYHAMKKMRSKRPIKAMTRPKLKLQAYMFDITTSKKFDMAIMIIIGLNMFVMALEHYGQSAEFSLVLENLNVIFIAIFTLECLCKIFAMRHFYFREPWNIFDFIVVDLSILGVVMKEYVAKYFVSPTLLRVVRVVKVGRVLRLVKGAKGIRTLLFALAMSLPALFNICLLLFLVMFIYAIFGMSFFMNVRKRAGIDETFNFETFTSSIIVLFQMSTSANWDLVLDPLMDEENDCQKPDPALGIEGTCGNKGVAIFYLISYVIVTFLIIINMYIAVILENYSQATEDVQEGLTDDDYEMYYEIWQKFDPDGTQYLPYNKLSEFLDALEDPLRIPKPNELALVVLDINIYEGYQCYCVDILDALTKYFFTRKGLVIQVNEHLQKVQSTLHETPFERITTTYMVKREHYCARIIQNAWRRWRSRVTKNARATNLEPEEKKEFVTSDSHCLDSVSIVT